MIADCLAVRVRLVSRSLSSIYEHALAHHQVTIAQVNLLAALGQVGPCSPGKIGDLLQLERSTVCRNLDLLVERGLVACLESDAKGMRAIILSEAGEHKLETVMPDWEVAQARASSLLGNEGVNAVHEASGRVWNSVF